MTDSHWQPAIQTALDSESGIYDPQSFRDYPNTVTSNSCLLVTTQCVVD
jgi:hypothetical protein